MAGVAVTTASGRCVQLLADFSLADAELRAEADRVIAEHNAKADAVAAVPITDVSVKNTLEALSQANFLLLNLKQVVGIRIDSGQWDRDCGASLDSIRVQLMSAFLHTCFRVDIFERICALHAQRSTLGLSSDHKKALRTMYQAGVERGMLSDEHTCARIREFNKVEAPVVEELEEPFVLSATDLYGLSSEFLSTLPRTTHGDMVVAFTPNNASSILTWCMNARTRELVWRRFSKFVAGSAVCARALTAAARFRAHAGMFGYTSYSDKAAGLTIAKTARRISTFLDDLHVYALPAAREEVLAFARTKAVRGDAETLKPWDVLYYQCEGQRDDFASFMPKATVVDRALRLCGLLFGLRFEVVACIPPALRWCTDLDMFVVVDTATNAAMGVLYLDLWDRPGKSSGPWMRAFRCVVDGSRTLPCAAVFCCAEGFRHFDVISLFHELGHALHFLCARGTFRHTEASYVEYDFLETPSQLLEHWAWNARVLVYLSGDVLPLDIAKDVVRARNVNAGGELLRSIFEARLDMVLCGPGPPINTGAELMTVVDGLAAHDCGALFVNIVGLYRMLERFPESTAGMSYRYLWGEADSADLFCSLFQRALNDKSGAILGAAVVEAGARLRECILEPGPLRDGADMLEHALGRQPTIDAFLRLKGFAT